MNIETPNAEPKRKRSYGAHRTTSLTNLHTLPDEALIDGRVAAQLLCCSYNHVFRLSREGRLASPIKTGQRSTRWKVGAIRAFLAGLTPSETA